jgi:hypothetical protein
LHLRVVQGALSPLVETASLITVAVFTNAAALGVFALVHVIVKPHTPDVHRILADGSGYIHPVLDISQRGVSQCSSCHALLHALSPTFATRRKGSRGGALVAPGKSASRSAAGLYSSCFARAPQRL